MSKYVSVEGEQGMKLMMVFPEGKSKGCLKSQHSWRGAKTVQEKGWWRIRYMVLKAPRTPVFL